MLARATSLNPIELVNISSSAQVVKEIQQVSGARHKSVSLLASIENAYLTYPTRHHPTVFQIFSKIPTLAMAAGPVATAPILCI